MSWPTDIALVLENAGVGVYGTNIFIGSKKTLPMPADYPDPLLSIIETPGTGQERTHNAVVVPAYQGPEAQIVARHETYEGARDMAWAAYYALVKVRNQYIGSGESFVGSGDAFAGNSGTFYREISPRQEPFDIGLDSDKLVRIAFNVLGKKRPSKR